MDIALVPLQNNLGLGIVGLIVVGLIAGAIAKAILPGKAAMGWLLSLILGVVGALVGGWIGSIIGASGGGFFSLWTWILAILGCVIVFAIYGAITGRKV